MHYFGQTQLKNNSRELPVLFQVTTMLNTSQGSLPGRLVASLVCISLAACGGGRGSNDTTGVSTAAPVVGGVSTESPPTGANPDASTGGTTPGNSTPGGSAEQPAPDNPLVATVRFDTPQVLAFDPQGNLIIGESGNDAFRKITPSGSVTTFGRYQVWVPAGLTFDLYGNMYSTDTKHSSIVVKRTPGGEISAYSGSFIETSGLATDPQGNVYVADLHKGQIHKISQDGTISVFAGKERVPPPGPTPISGPDNPEFRFASDGTVADAVFPSPVAVTVDREGNLYVLDANVGHFTDAATGQVVDSYSIVRKITVSTGMVTTIAGQPAAWGDGPGWHGDWGQAGSDGLSRRMAARGIAVDASGNVYVADRDNRAIRKLSLAGQLSTLAGGLVDNKPFPLKAPTDIAIAVNGDLYVTDSADHTIRKVTQDGVMTVFAGKSGEAGLVDTP